MLMSLAEEGKNLPSPLNPDREDLGDFDFHIDILNKL